VLNSATAHSQLFCCRRRCMWRMDGTPSDCGILFSILFARNYAIVEKKLAVFQDELRHIVSQEIFLVDAKLD